MATPFKFEERKHQNYHHDIKVFIMGADVTPWLMSDISVTYAKNGGVNTASFTLSNQNNAFVLTERNLSKENTKESKFFNTDPYSPSGQYSEQAKMKIWNLKNTGDNNLSHEVNTYGPVRKQGSNGAKVLKDTLTTAQAQSSATQRYPATPGSLVFHKFDHIRIFAKNPLNTDSNEWYVVYTGFLDTKPYDENLVNGMSTVRISSQDIRYAMQRMRTQLNPASSVANANATQFALNGKVKDSPNAGMFNDLVGGTIQINHVLGGLSFRDSINYLLLGVNPPARKDGVRDDLGETSGGLKKSLNSVGEMVRGTEVSYNPEDEERKGILTKWNNLILFGQYSDSASFLTYEAMLKKGQNTHEWGTESVWKTKVHFLFPSTGAPNSNLIETSIVQGQITDRVQWASRLELILGVCDNLEYVMYVSPLGDVVFEFPMWDFNPSDFGAEYEKLYTFKDHIISRNTNDEGGEAISAIIMQSRRLFSETRDPNEEAGGVSGYAPNKELTRTIYSNPLASRIGVQVKTVFKPGITDPDQLTKFGMIEFQKAISDYNKFSFKAQYRPFLNVNRPIYDINAYKIGSCRTVSTTWRLRDSVDIDIDLIYVRRGELDNNNDISFRFITGGESSPISYNKIYSDTSIPGSGISSAAKNGGSSEEDN